jgi:hypothetical protein
MYQEAGSGFARHVWAELNDSLQETAREKCKQQAEITK